MTKTFFNTELALIQAPMAGVQNAKMAVAVCNAGGLGSLPCAMLTKEQLISELDYLTSHTDKPYNLNFFCHTTPNYSKQQQMDWHQLLTPYFAEFHIDASGFSSSASRTPIDQSVLEIIAPYKPPIVSFHFGLPAKEIVSQIKKWGGQVWSSATTFEEACFLKENGVDAIIAQGIEAGGHRGHFLSTNIMQQPTTKQLVKQCVTLDVPIIAAGGISKPEDVTAFQRLGAGAVQIGSAYLLSNEATTSEFHRAALKKPHQTVLTTIFSGRPARGIVNRAITELGSMPSHVPPFPFASIAMTALRARAEAAGKSDFSPLWCGQHFVVRDGVNASEITQLLMRGWHN